MKEQKYYFLDVPNGIYSCPEYIEGGSEKALPSLKETVSIICGIPVGPELTRWVGLQRMICQSLLRNGPRSRTPALEIEV